METGESRENDNKMDVQSDIEGQICKREELRKRLDIEDVADVVRMSRLGWFGHLERKDEGDWVSAYRNIIVPEYAGKGRPRKRWRDVFEDDLKKGRLDRGLAKDRDRWRAQIMGKTSEMCEQGKRDVKEKRETKPKTGL